MDDEYANGLTEADVLDTIAYFVHADRRAAAAAAASDPRDSHQHYDLTADAGISVYDAAEEDDDDDDDDESRGSPASSSSRDDATPLAGVHGACAPSSSHAAPTAAPGERVNGVAGVHKSRQKQELEYLKAKVRELEQELRRVEQANDEKLVEVGDSLWQRMAQQQSIERQKSLSENAKLKAQLEAQLRFSKSLEKIIRKRPSLVALGAKTSSPAAFQRRKRKAGAENLYEELMESAAHEYHRTDEVMRAMQVHEMFTDQRSVNIRVCKTVLDADPVIRVETIEVRRFPFPFQSVAREWWKFVSQASHLEEVIENCSRKVESTSDAHFATTSMQFPVGGQVGVMNASAVIRRFHEEDCTVITYVSHADCSAKKNPKGRFSVVEKGWIHIKPLPGSPGSSIFQSVSHFTPTPSDQSKVSEDTGSSDSDAKEPIGSPVEAGILTEVILNVYQKTASYIYSVIENALMEEHLHNQQLRFEEQPGDDGSRREAFAHKRPPAAF